MAKITIISCPTQQKWLNLMMRGAESRMCWTSKRHQPLGVGVIGRLLNLIKEEAEDQEQTVAREYYKVGAAVATALCGSLRGSEVFMLELAALRRHIKIGQDGTLPPEPMKAGMDLLTAPHVIITLLGEFKGKLGFKYHLMSLASTTSLGIKLRWWLEKLIYVREEEGCISGPAFGHKDGSVAMMKEYDKIYTISWRSSKWKTRISLPKQMTFNPTTAYPVLFVEHQKAGPGLPTWTVECKMR
jgi:hypothetical protein